VYDLIVIGAGPGGYEAAAHAARMGKKVALVEAERIGGTCLNVGCIPAKAFLRSSKLFHECRQAAAFGVRVGTVEFDMPTVVSRKDRIVGTLTRGVEAMLKRAGVEVITGRALIASKNAVRVGPEQHECRNILVATGSRPAVPPIPGITGERVLDSNTVFALDKVPESIAIIGGGYIGLEFACFFNEVGTKVTVYEMLPQIASGADQEICTRLLQVLSRRGIDFKLSSKVLQIEGTSVQYIASDGATQSTSAEFILNATGRVPVVDDLGLENVGVDFGPKGIRTSDEGKTNIPGIWACGDVTGRRMLAHAATREGIVAVNNMFGKRDRIRYRAVPAVIYTHPEVASVGRTEEELKSDGIAYKRSVVPMGVAGRFIIENEGGTGFVKVLTGAQYGEILGVHAMGDASSEFIVTAAAMVETEMCVEDASETIHLRDIPVNAYNKSIHEEVATYSREDFVDIWRDMCGIREFETILNEIKTKGAYKGITYNHAGPAHLSIGQEAAAVGMAFSLTADDHIFGSHRSHGEILAKGFSAIRQLSEVQLLEIMRTYRDGALLRPIEKAYSGDVKGLALRFFVYGAYSEIFARETGFNRGLGGSMHAFFAPFGIYPNNAIVGGSGSIAPGAALFKRVNRKPGIVVANIGDASFGCGPVWEGITFSAMDQYRQLWDEALGGGLPIIFNCMNNFYGMGGQPLGETMGVGHIARVGAGVNPDQMHAERVNGYDPLPVIDAFRRKKQVLLSGCGPVLLDTVTYRISGHSPSDASSYRSKEEIERWQQADSIRAFRKKLIENGIVGENVLESARAEVEAAVFDMFKAAVDLEASPRVSSDSELVGSVMFSNQRVERFDNRTPEFLLDTAENPRVQQIRGKIRTPTHDGKPVPKMKAYNVRDAIFEAMLHRFSIDPTMIAFGEENRDWGGAFAVYRGLTEALPYHRLFNSPISEAGIVGAAVGYALEGGRVVAELMYADFMGRAGDEIFNQLSKWQSMSAGQLTMPVVLRISVGAKYGAQHSQDWTALVHHIPGLKVVYPVTPYDAKGLMNAALAGTDPVIFFESQKIYDFGEMFVEEGVPEGYYEIPLGEPSVKRKGKDLTIITLGPTLYTAIAAADELQSRFGVSAEVIDLRAANPLDYDPLIASVRKTGKVLLACDAVERGCVLNTVAANVTQLCFDHLDGPPVVIGSRNWITPAAELEALFFPQPGWLLDAIHERILPLKDYQARTNQTLGELARRTRLGI
jgi:2-oxoisovalerate dehydrogenase E1 component